jgi:hypothetical protein
VASKVGRAVFEIGLEDAELKAGIRDIGAHSKKAAGHLRGIGQAVNLAVFRQLATIGVGAVKALATEIVALGQRGAMVDDVSSAFRGLTERTGETADAMLGQLRSGVAGTLGDFELMKLANKTLGSGLVESAEDMGVLASGARALAKRVGGDTKQAFEMLTSSMASGETAQLKQLGLFVDNKTAVEAHAAALDKNVSELTDTERAQALAKAALAALRTELLQVAPPAADFGEKIEMLVSIFENFKDKVAVAVAQSPVLSAMLASLASGLEVAFGGDSQSAVSTVVSLIESLAFGMVKAGQVTIEVARFASNAWQGLIWMFNSAMSAIARGLATIVSGLATVLEAHAQLPVVGQLYAGAAVSVRGLADGMQHLSTGFDAQAEAALDSAAKTNAALDSAQAGLKGVETAMRDAAGASREADASIRGTAVASQAAAESTRATSSTTAAEIKRQADQRARDAAAAATLIAETERRLQQETALMRSDGLKKELLELEYARQAEIAQLEELKLGYSAQYTELTEAVNAKYTEMTATAQASHMSIETAAEEQGFKTRAELEDMAATAHEMFKRMEDSGLYTTGTLQEAWEAYEEARRNTSAKTEEFTLTSNEAISQGVTQIFGLLGQKYKAAAIAGAIISTYQAVAKALASAPWPASLVLAAGAAAAGFANVAKIRSSDAGFREGTPNLDFMNFGDIQMRALHDEEAVIPRGGGHLLASEIASALPRYMRDKGGEMGSGRGDVTISVGTIQGSADPEEMSRALVEGLRRGGMSRVRETIRQLR